MNAGFLMRERLMCVLRLEMKREGEAFSAIGVEMMRFRKHRKRRDQRTPTLEMRACTVVEIITPPMPAPERTMPMAPPRWVSKYSGVTLRIGK